MKMWNQCHFSWLEWSRLRAESSSPLSRGFLPSHQILSLTQQCLSYSACSPLLWGVSQAFLSTAARAHLITQATLLCNRVLSHYIWCHCTTRAGNWSEQKVSELDCGDEGMAFGKQKANGSANRGGQKLCVNVIGKILIGQWTVYFGGVTIHSIPFNVLIGIVDISRLVDRYLMKILSLNA